MSPSDFSRGTGLDFATRAYTTPSAGVNPRPREISLVALMALSTFRSPYAGGFFEAASRIFASSMAFATNETLGSLLLPLRG